MTDRIPTPPNDGPAWAQSRDAIREERQWDDEDALRGQRSKNDLWALTAVGIATVCLIIFFAVIFIMSLGAWIMHQVMPESYFWLSEAQLSKIQSVIFSGAIGAVVTSYAQKHMND